jgi:hypothetical protein
LSYQYEINRDTQFIINPRFEIYFNQREGESRNVEGLNPVFGIAQRYKFSDKLTLSAQYLTNLVNVEKGTRESGQILNPGGFNTLNYKVSSAVSVGTSLWYNFYFYENNNDQLRYSAAISPYVVYSFNDKVAARFFVDQSYDHDSSSDLGNVQNVNFITYLAVDLKLSKNFGMMPYIASDMTRASGTQATSVGAWFWGSIF